MSNRKQQIEDIKFWLKCSIRSLQDVFMVKYRKDKSGKSLGSSWSEELLANSLRFTRECKEKIKELNELESACGRPTVVDCYRKVDKNS
jgi:hypothetical protein